MQLIRRSDEDMHHEMAIWISKRLCHMTPKNVEGSHCATCRAVHELSPRCRQ
jgi:hypothetical protein